jgi:electron transport complex protein RnfD
MDNRKLFVSSHAPYLHSRRSISGKSYHIVLATLPALGMGFYHYGIPAVGVVALAVSSAMFWEFLMNMLMRRPISIGDGNAAMIGLLLAMLLPATTPWWVILAGTFVAIIVGKQIFGGLGCNPLNPTLVALAILFLSWKGLLDFDTRLVNYDLPFEMAYPLSALKNFGISVVPNYSLSGLFMGQQSGGIGASFGLGLIIGGLYLMLRGYIRWEISLHLVTGYTLIGAFFLATEDSSSPVNFLPMLIYGASAGALTVLIRNIGAFEDGVIFAILMMNVANPLLDKIRPKAMGRGMEHA